MSAFARATAHGRQRDAECLRGTRLFLVDSDAERLALHRRFIELEGGPETEGFALGDEALDALGAAAQQVDAVVVWPWLADDGTCDLFGILRRCRSPVRLLAATTASPAELGRAGRLAGVAAVADTGRARDLVRTIAAVLAGADSVEAIVTRRRAPRTLSQTWAAAIHGTAPGQRFHADLD